MKNRLVAALVSVLLASPIVITPSHAEADEMRTFLLSCAYGTMIGAAVGLATVAISDDPGAHTQNIAKGASLGLYAGIGLGLYLDYGRQSSANSDLTLKKMSPIWLQADSAQGHVQGGSLHWMSYRF
jgi:hypothetical protein